MRETTNAYRFLVELKGKGILQYLGVDERIILQSVLKNGQKDLAWVWGQVKSFCENCTVPLFCVTCAELLAEERACLQE